jgi:2-aminobenzoate-CoA ligase
MASAHVDTFTRDHLPATDQLPEFIFDLPELKFSEQLNCADELMDWWVREGEGHRPCILAPGVAWTYADLQERANRIANVLAGEMGVVPGNRVLLRAANNPMLAACWFAVMKVGAVAVASMPLLRAKELVQIIDKAQVTHALCDAALAEELQGAAQTCSQVRQIQYFNDSEPGGLESAMARQSPQFTNVQTAAEDTCILAFTSGTTGLPKATIHNHRDVLAACQCWPRSTLRLERSDVVIGSPPLAFTFGLGGLLLFPLHAGATTVLLERAGPRDLVDAIPKFGATVLFTAPTSYRAMADAARAQQICAPDGGTLRKCVSAGEALSATTRSLWKEATGIEMIDGIGSTEMLHIFISAEETHARAGATGKAVAGYRACVMNERGQPLPPGVLGRLAVKGPTGCRYLDDPRQQAYVKDGWNYTGDAYSMDEDGYFHFHSRTDDMIVSAGYNIAATDVEDALHLHPAVAECAVLGAPDEERGQIVKAFIVVKRGVAASPELTRSLQDHVKKTIAPYKYPRAIEYRASLPRTATGKLQRFQLREK